MSAIYDKEVWDNYPKAFLANNPTVMLELNKAVAKLAHGNVADFGSGAAKIAPFALDNSNVISYTGFDASPEMVKLARWHLAQFPGKPSEVIKGNLEKVTLASHKLIKTDKLSKPMKKSGFDFGLSINSYYAWSKPTLILRRIYDSIKSNGHFVLVTPNHKLDMQALAEEAKRELVANPYFESFRDQNLAISANDKANLIEMDDLIEQVRAVGFKVIEANQHFYHNGLNFLLLTK